MKTTLYGTFDSSWMDQQKKNVMNYEYQERIRRSQSSTNKSKGKKKKLNYNPKEVSIALRRSVKSTSASLALTQARVKLANLMKCKSSGQYDDAELKIAIVHAKKMVQCGKMKLNNLKREEQQQRANKRQDAQDGKNVSRGNKKEQQKQEREVQERRLRELQMVKSRKRMVAEEKLVAMQRMKSREHNLNQTCNDNRAKEKKKLDEADLEYLKRNLERMAREEAAAEAEKQTIGTGAGVSFDMTCSETADSYAILTGVDTAAAVLPTEGAAEVGMPSGATVGGGVDISV